MLSLKKLPWTSITILLFAYITYSWFLCQSDFSPFIWVFSLVFALILAGFVSAFMYDVRVWLTSWLQSDVGYFAAVFVAAFLATVVLIWIRFFAYILVLLAATILARLDLRTVGFNELQAFWLLFFVSMLGLGLGFLANNLIA